ncbi:MAG: hypothetical protein ACOX68_00495 [Candidatus Limivicinus sp.]|jgi:hypothetical protein
MYDLPPILSGSEREKITALREYLVRMANQLNAAEGAASAQDSSAARVTGDGRRIYAGGRDARGDIEDIRKNAKLLRQLIVKSSDELSRNIVQGQEASRQYADGQIDALGSEFLCKSEFGSFTENIESQISTTARGVVESYGLRSKIESNQDSIELLQSYITDINGEIRRGIVRDPGTDEDVTGIAVSQNLQFTGAVTEGEDGVSYYRLSSGQTFGLYTSTGWQFWIDGFKKGWYDSVDGMLHIANVAVEDTLQLGGSWRLMNDGGLGIKYVGD